MRITHIAKNDGVPYTTAISIPATRSATKRPPNYGRCVSFVTFFGLGFVAGSRLQMRFSEISESPRSRLPTPTASSVLKEVRFFFDEADKAFDKANVNVDGTPTGDRVGTDYGVNGGESILEYC